MAGALLLSGSAAAWAPPATGSIRLPVTDKQEIRFTQLSINGDPFQEGILSITQDKYGFLWLGTNAGLYRYDGYNLKAYRHDPNNPDSLSDNRIRVVYRDRDGFLWIGGGNHAGLDRLDPRDGSFRHYRHDPADERTLSDNGVGAVHQDGAGVLWVGTRSGLNRLDAASGTFVRYYPTSRDAGYQSSNNIISIVESRRGHLWLGTRVRPFQAGQGHRTIYWVPARSGRIRDSLAHDYVSSIREDESGRLWVGATMQSGLSALDVNSGEFTHYSFHSPTTAAVQCSSM